jgi:hypothetical protein
VDVMQDSACVQMMESFIKRKPELWSEDIGL